MSSTLLLIADEARLRISDKQSPEYSSYYIRDRGLIRVSYALLPTRAKLSAEETAGRRSLPSGKQGRWSLCMDKPDQQRSLRRCERAVAGVSNERS